MINIVNKVECCGCEACYNACPKRCIEMKSDEEGFLYPRVDIDNCIDCGLCEMVCPIINHIPGIKNDNQEAYLLQHKNKKICKESTAGGAFTGIASYVIEKGGVVFGVELTKDFFVQHTSVETIEDLKRFRNSKYVQSNIGEAYRNVKTELKSGRLVCFSGTPCQIEGLRHFLGKEYENLVLVDIVCRAVPSPGVWKEYIKMECAQNGIIDSVRFRDKTLGYQYSTMELRTKDGKVKRGGIESQPWLRMFFSGMIIRPSCTECKFRSRYRNSDFTIWDCFNIHSLCSTLDESAGVTRVLVHSDKGKRIMAMIGRDFNCCKISSDDAVRNVIEMVASPRYHVKRTEFFNDFYIRDIFSLINEYFPLTFKLKIREYIRLKMNHIGVDKIIRRYIKK